MSAAGSAQAWAHWCSCPADFVHASWLPEALMALQSSVKTANAQRVVHQLLAAHLKLKAVARVDIEQAPAAGLCLLAPSDMDRLTQPDADPALLDWYAAAWPGTVLGGSAAQRESLRRERATILLVALAAHAWPATLVQRWRLRFDARYVQGAEQHRLPMDSRLAARRLRNLLWIAQRLEPGNTTLADKPIRQPARDESSERVAL